MQQTMYPIPRLKNKTGIQKKKKIVAAYVEKEMGKWN